MNNDTGDSGATVPCISLLETLADIHKELAKRSDDAADMARVMAEEKAYDLAANWQARAQTYASAALAVQRRIDKVSNGKDDHT